MLPPTPFYLLRHGESEANLSGKAAGGGVDSPLTPRGEDQARALAEVVHDLKIKPSIIFSSSMQRARRTAELVNETLGLSHTVLERLEEHHVGDWEGQPWSEIGPKMKADINPPNGESYVQYAERVKTTLNPALSRTYETPPLIVAHGGTFYAIGRLYGWKITETQNCHLHRFDPYPDHAEFPWQVFEYNIRDFGLYERRSSYCPLSRTKGESL